MNSFYMNGYLWHVKFVNPNSDMLVDRTGEKKVATADPETGHIYLADDLEGDFLTRVLVHELGHCAMFSFHLLQDIHRVVLPEHWIEAEEWVCNFIANYGLKIFYIAYSILGENAWIFVPQELERLIA